MGIKILACCSLVVLFATIAPGRAAATLQAPDVCALMPRDEVMKIVNRKDLGQGRASQLPEGAAQCRYAGGPPEGSITLVAAKSARTKWDAFIKDLQTNGAKLEAAPGVGAAAFFWDNNRLYAHSGTHEVSISTSPTPNANVATIRADEIALAKALLGKLK